MPAQASIPGKPHKPGWSPAKPYVVPDDPMPRRFGGSPSVRAEAGLDSNKPAPLDVVPAPSAVQGESPVPRAESAVSGGDGIRRGVTGPRQPDGRFARDPAKFAARVPGR